ncbi:hypothetical protein [Streptomyces zaomyceticus]|uniref:hypothetical protein n=1 Tax=Streptomyces zaomyceticus TaxID=68286 RepID=UPI00343AB96C
MQVSAEGPVIGKAEVCGVMVGDGHRRAGALLRAAQGEVGFPSGVWEDESRPRST